MKAVPIKKSGVIPVDVSPKPRITEVVAARKYYGAHATGTVVLIDGNPIHFVGEGALREARTFAAKFHSTVRNCANTNPNKEVSHEQIS